MSPSHSCQLQVQHAFILLNAALGQLLLTIPSKYVKAPDAVDLL